MSQKRKVPVIIPIVAVILIVGGIIYFQYHHIPRKEILLKQPVDTVQVPVREIPKLYDIPIDSFEVEEGIIRTNQTLGNLLQQYRLPNGTLAKLSTIPRDTFDLRKIRSGHKYTVFLEKDSLKTLRYFVYEHSVVSYNKLCFFDSVWAETGHKKVDVVQRKITGTIKSSLWNAMVEAHAHPMLANDLSDIYAWSIDFFGLQVNDSFTVVCNEQYVDTVSIGYGKILGCYFKHADAEFIAIPFFQNHVESYYDENGNSLKKAFLKAPLNYSRISSRFSNNRLHPVLKIRRPHHGVDYAAPKGTHVFAIGDGRVIAKGYQPRGGGNYLKIKHNSVYTTVYMHLNGFAKGIGQGSMVKQGQLIGYVGSTGLATGPHLDFRVFKNGKAIDPLKVHAPPVEPISDSNRVAFDSVKAYTLKLLE